MELSLLGNSFYGGDFGTVFHHRKRETTKDALSIAKYRTGAALAMIAALFAAGQV